MDLQEAFDAGFVAVKAYVDAALAEQTLALPDLIKAAVQEALAALPPPKDGEPGRNADPVTPAQIDDAVRAYLEANSPAPGKDAEPDVIRQMVEEAVASIPAPKDGADADPAVIERMVAEAVAAIPKPKDGESFDPETLKTAVDAAVAALPPAKDGESITAADVAPMIAEEVERAVASKDIDPEVIRSAVAEAVAALPPPAPGKDADPVTDQQIAEAVKTYFAANPIKTAEPGRDGVGLAGALIDKDGNLVVTLTDGTMRELGKVVGRDGADAKGEPGRDALTLSNFDTSLSEDGRTLTLSLENEEARITHELQLPVMIYRGVFKDGQTYVQGDTVTFGGCLWHCNAETTEKPLEGKGCWQLAARKGRDGKDAKP